MIRIFLIGAVTLLIGACAPISKSGLLGLVDVSRARITDEALVSYDGARLGLNVWEPEEEPWAVIIGLHGMNDHSGSFWRAGPYWAEQGIATYAFDQRGFGRSPGRGSWPGGDVIVHDIDAMVEAVRRKHPDALIAVAGVSMGGAAAIAAFSREDAPEVDRVILLAPAVWGWSTQPLQNRAALWLASFTMPNVKVSPPKAIVRQRYPTDNREELTRLSSDPLMLGNGASTESLAGLMDLMQTAWLRTGRIAPPTFYAYGYRDDIIPVEPSLQAASRLKPGDQTAFYRDGYHLLLSDNQAWRVWDDVVGFLHDPEAPPVSGAPPLPR
jgi:acylglycerol lipase